MRNLLMTPLAPLLLALPIVACDRGPTPQGNAAQGEEPASESTMAAEAPGDPHAGSTDPHAGLGGGQAPAAAPVVSADNPNLAGVAWATHEPLVWRQPTRPMRNGEYAVGAGEDEAVLTVFHFPGMGGTLEDNVERWTRQFRTSDGSPAEATVNTRTIGGLEVTSIDTSGTFTSSMPMGGASGPQNDQRMLGAIVTGPNGPVFFKLIGPAATVATASEAFGDLVNSLHAE